MWRVYTMLVGATLFWGGTFVAGRVLATEMGPFAAAFVRFALASVFLSAWLLGSGGGFPRLSPRQFGAVAALGATGVFAYNVLFFSGLETVEAGRAAVIIAANPIFIALFSAALFGERLTLVRVAGILLSVTGAVVVITRGEVALLLHGRVGAGEWLLLGCVFSWVAYTLIGNRLMRGLSPVAAVTCSAIAGTVLLALPAWRDGLAGAVAGLSPGGWSALFYLALFGTVLGFVWFYHGVKAIGPSRAGLFINLVPVSAVLLGHLLLAEPVTASLAWGTALVVSGLLLTNRYG